MGTAVAPGRSPTEVTCGVAGTAGYSEHLDYTIHSFVIKCILTICLYILTDAQGTIRERNVIKENQTKPNENTERCHRRNKRNERNM